MAEVPYQNMGNSSEADKKFTAQLDPESQVEIRGMAFSEESIRKAFIRKVYLILTVQLAITMAFISLFVYSEPTKLWTINNPWIAVTSFITMFAVLIVMACCGEMRRKTPHNFIFLGLFTIAQGLMLGIFTIRYDAQEVLTAVGITCAICFGLTLFSLQTKWDFTMMGGFLFVGLLVVFMFGIIVAFFPGSVASSVYSACGALLFSLYLIYDTQIMMGGNHKYSISPEEYIFAALNLYLDIINIFMFILRR
ncbi:protein lifeguard 1-like [Topomyia yanbarensis]|uniref:protein lifeguard 1-like n=1 Tax=Topomyia yanbarensis TaxID=2498891 RepID=UPI00273C214B|nr:protein lifeguard 1-like [Topomyia yanbarensis]